MDRHETSANTPVVAEVHVTGDSDLRPSGQDPQPPVHDCWNVIGVNGNSTCRELQKFVHCRNCPVYSAAAMQLLDRPLAPELRREWSEHYALVKRLSAPARTSVVIFRIAAEWLALPTVAFQEVAEKRAMHTLPHRRRSVVLGLVNVRGELLICASLGQLLHLEERTARPRARAVFDRILVVSWEGQRLAFPVEEVQGIHHFQTSELREAPATVGHSTLTFTRGVLRWRERTIGLLDAKILFSTLNRSLS